MESEPMLTPKGKIPPTGRLGGGSNSCCCITQDSKPDTLPSELFRPLTRTNSLPDTNIKDNRSELFWCRHIYLWRGYSLQRWQGKKWSCIYVETHLMTNLSEYGSCSQWSQKKLENLGYWTHNYCICGPAWFLLSTTFLISVYFQSKY